MGYRILLVGSGGREHALAWKLLQSPLCDYLIAAPGNPGIEALGRAEGMAGKVALANVGAEAIAELVALAKAESIDLVVCGPEVSLMAGLGDACALARIRFFGPSRAAAKIEGSKEFAKDLMKQAGVPTAAYGSFSATELAAADAFIDAQPGDVVVKANGLCAGKGVVVASSHAEAKQAVRAMLVEHAFGAAGARVVIEERLVGREVSMMALCDGTRFVLLASARITRRFSMAIVGPTPAAWVLIRRRRWWTRYRPKTSHAPSSRRWWPRWRTGAGRFAGCSTAG